MAVFHTIRKLKNSKSSEIDTNSYMSDSNGSKTNPIVNNHEINIDNESKTRVPSQKKSTSRSEITLFPWIGS